jgi:RNA polymerase sigma-70 factor, ECF subfamily
MPQPLPATEPADPPAQDFAALVRRHQAMVYSIALHFLADRSTAEELAQDVFLQLHANLSTLTSENHVTFWLRKVTAHRCIDYKRRHRPPQISLDDAPEPAAPSQPYDPLLQRKLRQLIGALPENARIVMILRYQEDLAADEIAEILAMPLATVKSHIQRSLVILREKAARVFGDPREASAPHKSGSAQRFTETNPPERKDFGEVKP